MKKKATGHTQQRTPLVPLNPQPGPRRTLQITVDSALAKEAAAAAKHDRRNLREVIEWGMKEYLAHKNPESLQRLGVVTTDTA